MSVERANERPQRTVYARIGWQASGKIWRVRIPSIMCEGTYVSYGSNREHGEQGANVRVEQYVCDAQP